MFSFKLPRMAVWLILTVVLMALALWLQFEAPGNLVAVTLYKAHLLSLGGWGGYWLDRALFPYDRPHAYLELDKAEELKAEDVAEVELISGQAFGHAMIRRAIIVAACLITVGLGA